MDTLNSLNPVRGRHRATSSVSALPIPQAPEHTNHRHYQIESNLRRQPYSVLSSSAPSISHLSTHSNSSSGDLSQHRSSFTLNSNDIILGSCITLDFEGGTHVIVRPNRVIRGTVILDLAEKTLVTRIRIKFRGEEYATVKTDESTIGGKNDWIHQMITTFFEEEYKLFGNDTTPYSQSAWEELDEGRYEFPFALKFPNVNYPPSMEEPAGFGIRYIWSVHLDGPGLQSGLKSKEYITPYRPIIVATEAKEWTYRTTLMRDKKQPLAEVRGKLYKQSYCPDEPFVMQLNITTLHSECKINAIHFKFRKHHEGKMVIQQGTAFRQHIRNVIQGKIPVNGYCDNISEEVTFDVPTRLVSPSFISRNTRVCYDLHFSVYLEHGHVFKSETVGEFSIPLTIANLPYEQLLRIPDITSIQFYHQSKECPRFFDPELDEPPEPQGLSSELIGSLTAAINTPASTTTNSNDNNNMDDPPSYFSLPTLPPQLEIRRERKEKTVFMTTAAKSAYNISDIETAVIVKGLYDEGW